MYHQRKKHNRHKLAFIILIWCIYSPIYATDDVGVHDLKENREKKGTRKKSSLVAKILVGAMTIGAIYGIYSLMPNRSRPQRPPSAGLAPLPLPLLPQQGAADDAKTPAPPVGLRFVVNPDLKKEISEYFNEQTGFRDIVQYIIAAYAGSLEPRQKIAIKKMIFHSSENGDKESAGYETWQDFPLDYFTCPLDEEGNTGLHLLLINYKYFKKQSSRIFPDIHLDSKHAKIVEIIRHEPAAMHILNAAGHAPCHIATSALADCSDEYKRHDTELLVTMRDCKINWGTVDSQGKNCFYHVIAQEDVLKTNTFMVRIRQLLRDIAQRADINTQDNDGYTVLAQTIRQTNDYCKDDIYKTKYHHVIRSLLELHADPRVGYDQEASKKKSALELASHSLDHRASLRLDQELNCTLIMQVAQKLHDNDRERILYDTVAAMPKQAVNLINQYAQELHPSLSKQISYAITEGFPELIELLDINYMILPYNPSTTNTGLHSLVHRYKDCHPQSPLGEAIFAKVSAIVAKYPESRTLQDDSTNTPYRIAKKAIRALLVPQDTDHKSSSHDFAIKKEECL